MSILGFFSRKGTAASATVARDRLQILLAHERTTTGRPDLVNVLREEILKVIGKHISVERDKVQVKMDRSKSMSTLEIEIEIPLPGEAKSAAA